MRLEGWDARLNSLIESARPKVLEFGTWDCFKLTCAVIEALTGVDRWPEFAYRTRREAIAKLRKHGDFLPAFDWFFGSPHTHWKHARRGDIACGTESGRSIWRPFGVVVGADIVFLGKKRGITFAPINAATCVWRVG